MNQGHFKAWLFSNSYYFLPCTTDRVEQINKYMGSVNLTQIHITNNNNNNNQKNHRNFDSLLSTRSVDEEVEWIGKDKKRLPENRYKMFYLFFFFFTYLVVKNGKFTAWNVAYYFIVTANKWFDWSQCHLLIIFLVCLEKIIFSMKNCYIQGCYSTILIVRLSVMKMPVYHFMETYALVLKSMSRVKIIS